MSRLSMLSLYLLLQSCLPTGVSDAEDLSRHRSLWERQGPPAYEFIYQRMCECLPEHTMPMKINVREGQIRSVLNGHTGEELDPESHRALRIEELFALVQDALERGAHRVDVTYDPHYGYPVSIFVDDHPRMVDDEFQITAKDLRPVD